MEIKIIIQQTDDGKKVVYPLNFNEISQENKKYEFITRKDEAHKADFADAFSIQIKNEFKVYSLISSEIKDYLDRSGSFFAIRVIVPKQKSINSIQNLLIELKSRYVKHYQNKLMEQLNFDDLTIATEYFVNENNIQPNLIHGINKESYVFLDNATSLDTLFNDESVLLTNVLYVFDKDKTEPIVYENLLPFEDVKKQFRKIKFNTNNLLESLKVNDIDINIPIEYNFNLIVSNKAIVTYKEKDKIEIKLLSSNIDSFILVQEYNHPIIPLPPKSPSNIATIVAISFLSILILAILGYFYWDSNSTKNYSPNAKVSNTEIKTESTKFENALEFNVIDENEKRYGIVKPDTLTSFEFKVNENGSWSFKNRNKKNSFVDFFKKNIKDIFEIQKLTLDDSIKIDFISKLEKISNEKIPDDAQTIVTGVIKDKTIDVKKTTPPKEQINTTSKNPALEDEDLDK